jgi:hypothetical protein
VVDETSAVASAVVQEIQGPVATQRQSQIALPRVELAE